MAQVTLYSTELCGYCVRAKHLLQQADIAFEEIDLTQDPTRWQQLLDQYNWRTVPMIVIGDEFIGGYQELHAIHASGALASKVSA